MREVRGWRTGDPRLSAQAPVNRYTHHDKLRFTWRMVLANGKVFLEGTDFGELSSDGKLRRVVGFLGPLAPRADRGSRSPERESDGQA